MTDKDSWERYEKLVLDKLDAHGKLLTAIHAEQIRLQVEMGIVKTKLMMIGAVSGSVGGIITMLLSIYFRKG